MSDAPAATADTLDAAPVAPALKLADVITNLPPFADQRTRELARQVQVKHAKLLQVSQERESQQKRTKAMQQHIKDIQQELIYTMGLYDSKRREIETEKHLEQLAVRETSRLQSDAKQIQALLTKLEDQMKATQSKMFKDSEAVETLRAKLNISKAELENWTALQMKKEQDELLLNKYKKEDEAKIKHLSMQVQKARETLQKKKNQLAQQLSETQSAQKELERVSAEFRDQHAERQNLLQQWEQTVKELRKRDEQIEASEATFNKLRGETAEKRLELASKKRILEEQEEQISSLEKSVASAERTVVNNKNAIADAQTGLDRLVTETELLQKMLRKNEDELQEAKESYQNIQSEIATMDKRIAKTEEQRADAQKRLDDASKHTGSVQEAVEKMNEVLAADEKLLAQLNREIEKTRHDEYRVGKTLGDLKLAEKNSGILLKSSMVALKNLVEKSQQLEQQVLQQNEVLYNQSYQIQMLERKLRRVTGKPTGDDGEALKQRIATLTREHDEWKAKIAGLQLQLKKAQEELARGKRRYAAVLKKDAAVKENVAELELYHRNSLTQLNAVINEKEEMMVDESIMRLELQKLRSFLNQRTDEVLSLEVRHAQIQLALEERTRDMELDKESLRARLKVTEMERAKLAAQLREKATKIEKMKNKYRVIMSTVGIESDDAELAQAGILVQNTMKREEMRQESEQLQAAMARIEEETRSLENTLQLTQQINETNRAVVKNHGVDESAEKEKAELDERLGKTVELLKKARSEVQALQEQVELKEKQLAVTEADLQYTLQEKETVMIKLDTLKKELAEQQVKIKRASDQAEKYKSEMKKKAPSPEIAALTELDVSVKELRYKNKAFYDAMDEACRSLYGDSKPLEELMRERGLEAPSRCSTLGSLSSSRSASRPQTRQSATPSRAGRAASSASQVRPASKDLSHSVLMDSELIPALKNLERPSRSQSKTALRGSAHNSRPASQATTRAAATADRNEILAIKASVSRPASSAKK